MQIFIPNKRYWVTLEYRRNFEHERTYEDKAHYRPTSDPKSASWKNLQVEKEDRYLDETDCDNVEDFA